MNVDNYPNLQILTMKIPQFVNNHTGGLDHSTIFLLLLCSMALDQYRLQFILLDMICCFKLLLVITWTLKRMLGKKEMDERGM